MATSFRRELPYVFSFTLIVSVTLGLWDLKLFVCLPVNMYIKSIEISGFKSYGQRVEIKGFDPLFNAITGLNGSGKSNILDAICFVLGITNLQQVRANNLQELVYKNGQAGITKAAVSITFDNSDPSSSPLGYEQHKEIIVTRIVVIGGKNKFLINGTVANNHRVQDFFQSVSLNVNNPHFLIMQGRITKVLNMKPKEILSMVEEAAGTRMYEMKKESSLKLMMKKEERLKEIDSVVEEQITPTLTKLREERKDYVEYTKVLRELEHLTKLHVAWQFLRAKEMCTTSSEDAKRIEEEIKATQDKICEIKQKLSQMDEDMKALEKKRDEEAGGKLSDLEKILKEKQLNEAKVTNSLQNLKSVLKDSMKKKTELQKNQKEETAALTNREKDIANQEKKIKDLQVACEEDAAAVKAAEKHLQDVNAGLVQDAEGKAATIASQIMAAEQDIKRAETEEKMASMTLTKLKEELSKKQAAYTEMDESYSSNQNSYKAVEKQINKMRQEIEKIGYDEERARKVKATREQLEKEMRRLHDNLDEMRSRNTHMEFEYVDPVRNFDRRKVHGLVCNLIRLKDPATALALELAAGGRLFNVVVDNDQTGKLLLEQGQLRRRVTIIPLNKISSRPIERDVIQRAEKLVGKENVSTALSLISYNKEDEPAMEYVFGNVFICSNMEAAKRVAFTEGINKRCVTLEGEVFDPAGTLSGGSMTQKTRNLIELSKMRTMEEELQAKQQKLHEVVKEMQKLNSLGERYESLQSSYELKVSEMEALRRKVEQSNYHQQQQEIENLKKSIEEKQKIIVECKQLKKKSEARYKELKQTDTKSARQQELKNAEKALTDKQKKAAVSEKQYKEAEQQLEQFKLEAEDLRQSLANCKQQMTDVMATINEQEQKVTETDAKLKEMKDDVAKVSEEVKAHKNLLKSHSIELGKLQKAKDLLSKDCGNAQLHVQQLEHDIVKSKEDAKDAEKSVEKMLSTYPWIEEQRKYFGVPNTEYDFTNYDAKSTAHRLNSLQEAKGKLSKSVNIRAQNMLANAEEQYKDLQLKKKVVLNDREQIRMVIRELDEQKRRSLKTACEQVNKDFGSIFSTLLPGAKAKLMSQEDEKGAIEGLEFKVGFGDVWKESLTELSGGQRSLVALSLILSLLLFKPAPIYILDEVDAALDLSHTQNIGQMLKKHFQKSQFIVVSLKDGMFSNANVLFKTRFVDGMSTVTRISRKN